MLQRCRFRQMHIQIQIQTDAGIAHNYTNTEMNESRCRRMQIQTAGCSRFRQTAADSADLFSSGTYSGRQ
ncbi:hypothetical protein Tco_1524834 [Tanacetum coccineum]